MRLDCVYAVPLSSLVGFLSGYQVIVDRYKPEVFRASKTLPGLLYLAVRASIPGLAFGVLCSREILGGSHLWLSALATGVAVDILLRSSIFLKNVASPHGQVGQLNWGPYALLKWLEGFFLERIAITIAEQRIRFVRNNLPRGMDFAKTYELVITNLDGFVLEDKALRAGLADLWSRFEKDSAGSPKRPFLDEKYRYSLGYALLNSVGSKGFLTLVATNLPKAESTG
jgi:hypothetical protein